MRVNDFMRREGLLTVSPDTRVIDAVKAMYERGVGSVLIVGPDGRLEGIFTERDLVRLVATGGDLEGRIGDYMTRNPAVVRPEDPLPLAASKMVEGGFRHLPVVDNTGRLVGLLSDKDVLRAILASGAWP
ncbi:CBS domain-containing protein [Stetteria hydrogenophila]